MVSDIQLVKNNTIIGKLLSANHCFDDDTNYVQAIPDDFTHVFSPPQWRSKDFELGGLDRSPLLAHLLSLKRREATFK
jgi:hypothetical protein